MNESEITPNTSKHSEEERELPLLDSYRRYGWWWAKKHTLSTMFKKMIEQELSSFTKKDMTALDLGSGGGRLISFLLGNPRITKILAVDYITAPLTHSKKEDSSFWKAVEIIEGDGESADLWSRIRENYGGIDLIVSNAAIRRDCLRLEYSLPHILNALDKEGCAFLRYQSAHDLKDVLGKPLGYTPESTEDIFEKVVGGALPSRKKGYREGYIKNGRVVLQTYSEVFHQSFSGPKAIEGFLKKSGILPEENPHHTHTRNQAEDIKRRIYSLPRKKDGKISLQRHYTITVIKIKPFEKC